MPAIVEIDESNGNPSETVTHGIESLAMGTVDAPNMIQGATGAVQTPNSNSMQKALRLHLLDLGGSLNLRNIRAFCDPVVSGWSWFTNGHQTQATYDATAALSFVPPTADVGPVPHALPVSDILAANIGIAGSLSGALAAPGQGDYLYVQLRAASSATQSFIAPFMFGYDDNG